MIPSVLLVPEEFQRSAAYVVLFFKSLACVFAFPCSMILLTNSSPTLRLLGTLNGIAVAAASLGRSTGPAVSLSSYLVEPNTDGVQIGGALFSSGQKSNLIIIPWAALSLVSLLGLTTTLFMVDKGAIESGKPTEEEVESQGEDGPLLAEVEVDAPTYGAVDRSPTRQ